MIETAYKLVTTDAGLAEATAHLHRHPVVGVDTETTGFDPYRSRMRLIQLATPDQTFVIDLFKISALRQQALRDILASRAVIKVFHNAKFDLRMLLRHFGIEVRGLFDTMLASQLVSAGLDEGGYGLASISLRYLGEAIDKSLQRSNWTGVLSEAQIEYAARDAAVLLPLREKLVPRLIKSGMVEVAKLEFDCALPIAAMELAGMAIDVACWRKLVANIERAHEVLSTELRRELAAGIPQLSLFNEPNINLDSPAQVIEALANMGIKVEGTRSWQLQPLARDYSAVAKLLEYRTVQKALTSYGLPLLEQVHPITGRFHPDFHQIGATGGRMSCSDPNLQQVPNTPEYRLCFKAPAGYKLVIADYSQIELRILADWSQDTALVKALVSGQDLHRVTASQMLGVPMDEVSKEHRAAAKQLNYGMMYGLGATGLAARIDCSTAEAEDLIRKYFGVYSGVAEWLREAGDRAIRERRSRTRSGRLIHFRFDPADRAQVAATQRLGKNSPIQGSSADIIKLALTLLFDALKPLHARTVNCVHDEIVVEVPQDRAAECAAVVEREMTAAARHFIRSVPVTVDVVVSDAWLK